jgi:hypothetical protein
MFDEILLKTGAEVFFLKLPHQLIIFNGASQARPFPFFHRNGSPHVRTPKLRVSLDSARQISNSLGSGQRPSQTMPFTHDLERSWEDLGVEKGAGKQK